jgi:multidrug efflux pump subunit AcrA (membrane-fusion protein)
VVIARRFIEQRTSPPPAPKTDRRPMVQVISLTPVDVPIVVEAAGTVLSADTITVRSQVGGRVSSVHPALELGRVVPASAPLVEVEKAEFEIAVQSARSALARVKTDLTLEVGRRRVAEQELALLDGTVPTEATGRALVLREPQTKAVKAAIATAQAALDRAELELGRTVTPSPFVGLVLKESVAPGQLVTTQVEIATLARADEFWIDVAVPAAELQWIAPLLPESGTPADAPVVPTSPAGPSEAEAPRAPAVSAPRAAGRVRVFVDSSGSPEAERAGRLLRLTGQVDPTGRMPKLLVAVDDPLALKPENAGKRPLLLGGYVRVAIEGETLQGVYRVPRSWTRDDLPLAGNSTGSPFSRRTVVSLVKDGKLAFLPVEIVRRLDGELVVKAGGIRATDRVITSRLPTAIEGMELRVEGEPAAEVPAAPGKKP